MSGRRFLSFDWKGAHYRICSSHTRRIKHEIREQRRLLETYILAHPAFRTAFEPLDLLPGAPPVALRMAAAAEAVGVGPMAAVAGAFAQTAVEAAVSAGAREAIVENGGDIYAVSPHELVVGLYAGRSPLEARLAAVIPESRLPLSICSSSSHMGPSLSLGHCDLACVVARDAALADAAATLACNLVRTPGDISVALERVGSIPGVLGLLIAEEDRVGLAGDFPDLVRSTGDFGKKSPDGL